MSGLFVCISLKYFYSIQQQKKYFSAEATATHSFSIRSRETKDTWDSNEALNQGSVRRQETNKQRDFRVIWSKYPLLNCRLISEGLWGQWSLCEDLGLEASVYAHGLHGAGFHDVVQGHIPSHQGSRLPSAGWLRMGHKVNTNEHTIKSWREKDKRSMRWCTV